MVDPEFSALVNKHDLHFPTPMVDRTLLKYKQGNEKLLCMPKYAKCAFPTIDTMKKWVTESELKGLIEFGFKIYEISGNEENICITDFQTVFNSKHVEYKEITWMFL